MSNVKLSIVLPFKDQPLALRLTLQWLAQVLIPEMEIIVVDDGSAEPASVVVQEFTTRLPLRLIEQPNGGRARARNIGWQAARGRRVLFNDADRMPAQSDLTCHRDGKGIVIGRHMEFYFSRPTQVIDSLLHTFDSVKVKAREPIYPKLVRQHLFAPDGTCQSGIGWGAFLTGNVSLDRADLEQVGGFDEGFREWGVEHFELGYRLWQLGRSFSFAEKATNYHLAHPREAGFYRNNMYNSMQYFRQRHPDPVLEVFERFLFGETSLQNVELASPCPGSWIEQHPEPIMFKSLLSETLSRVT